MWQLFKRVETEPTPWEEFDEPIPEFVKPESNIIPSTVGGSFIVEQEADLSGLAEEIIILYESGYASRK